MKKHFDLVKNTRKSYSTSSAKKSTSVLLMTVLFFAMLLPNVLHAQNCSFNLKTESNIESVNDEGRVYFLSLENTSSQDLEINLSLNNTVSGVNPDESDASGNIQLNTEFLNSDGNACSGTFQVGAGSTLDFQVKVSVPAGTPFEHWNALLVSASSLLCPDYSASQMLYTFIPDPTQE